CTETAPVPSSEPALQAITLEYFSISAYDDHRTLHSFPTRRSSDLPGSADTVGRKPGDGGIRRREIRASAPAGACKGGERRSAPRSEEHTSELQSRENLVCRLLLEKKKKKPNAPIQSSCLKQTRVLE